MNYYANYDKLNFFMDLQKCFSYLTYLIFLTPVKFEHIRYRITILESDVIPLLVALSSYRRSL